MKKNKLLVFFLLFFILFTYVAPFMSASAEPAGLTAPNILLYSLNTGETVYSKNADTRIPIGPAAKIMTALLALENIKDLSAKISVPKEAVVKNSKNIALSEGELMSGEDLLASMLIFSANDAALTLAYKVGGGSIDKFIDMMNSRAKELGANNTVFANPTGLDDPDHYTTVNDLAKITLQAVLIPKFMELCNTVEYQIDPTNLYTKRRHFYTANDFISRMVTPDYRYRLAQGINSGYTELAGHCLVTVAKKDNYEYLCIVMGADKTDGKIMSYVDARTLLEWGFDNIEYKKIVKTSDSVIELPVTLSSESDHVVLAPEKDVEILAPKDMDMSKIQRKLDVPKSLEAPIKRGDVVGKLSLVYNGKVQTTVNLIAISSVKRSDLLYAEAVVKNFLSSVWVKLFIVFVVILFLFYIFLLVAKNRRPRKRRRKTVSRIDLAQPENKNIRR